MWLLVFLIPINSFASVRLEVVLFLVALVLMRGYIQDFLRLSWDLLLYLLFILVGIGYSLHPQEGWQFAETSFSLMAFPAIFYATVRLRTANEEDLQSAFLAGSLISSAVLLVHAVFRFSQSGDPSVFLFYELTTFLGFQPTYFAYYLIFAISVSLHRLWTTSTAKDFLIYAFASLFLFGVFLLTGGRTASVGIVLVLSYFVLLYLTEERKVHAHWRVAISGVMLLLLFFVNAYEQQTPEFLQHDGWERGQLWIAAIKALPSLWLGAGTGAVHFVLNDYYNQAGLGDFAIQNLNPHNQFLHTLIANGVIGVGLLLIVMARPLLRAVSYRSPMLIIYFFPIWVYSISEVILGRYQGVVFFAFVYSFVHMSCERKRLESMTFPANDSRHAR